MKNQVQLITYVDRLGGGNLADLKALLDNQLKGLFGGIHLLPFFFPIDGEDAGFDPADHTKVDERLGDWEDIQRLATEYDLMADMIVNHVSAESKKFKDYLAKGSESEYRHLFLQMHDVFPEGVKEGELLKLYRPRPGLPFSSIPFDDGRKGLFWTTFTAKQIDINVTHAQGWGYLIDILDTFERNGITLIRLDAAGYAVKKPGTNCFMIPETFDFIQRLKKEANSRGMEVLVEIHAHYKTQIHIAEHSDWVYDFALPPLVLHSIFQKTSSALKTWFAQSPRNAITVLDTHDGIGIVDAGPSSSTKNDGLLDADEVDHLVKEIHLRSKGGSLKATGAAASNVDLYQVNCSFFDALGQDTNTHMLARLIQFFAPGVPQVYYMGLLSGKNDLKLLEETGVGRDINRHYYDTQEIALETKTPENQALFSLICFRNHHPAFDGEFELLDSADHELRLIYFTEKSSAALFIDFVTLSFKVTSVVNEEERIYTQWSDFSR